MKTLNETIKVTPNRSNRTFTIRTYHNGKLFAKYRTYQVSRDEFNSDLYNTENDWSYYLRTVDNYYKVN
jgi:hypothetical protein